MFPRITAVRHLQDYELEIAFTDGTVARVDFVRSVIGRGGVFLPLQDKAFFSQVTVDSEAGTLVWPNGVDFCPDVIYAQATGKDVAELGTRLDVA